MAQLTAQIVSYDDEFKRQISKLIRACGVPVGIVEGGRAPEGSAPDLVVVDIRIDASSGMAAIERLRASSGNMSIFAIAAAAEPDLILQSMRAGANEFFAWHGTDQTQAARTMEESFPGAVRRSRRASLTRFSARREAPGRRRLP
jgi:CheY-like chemotaxis protein